MTRSDPFIGKVIDGRYRLLARLGAGGFGTVYKAEHIRLGAPFALKFLAVHLAEDPPFVARFEREARTTSQLAHPHIVSVVDFGEDPVLGLFLAMEFLEGETLSARIRRTGPQPPASVVRVGTAICEATRAG